jgi:hypothetical protein
LYDIVNNALDEPLIAMGRLSSDALKAYRKSTFCNETITPSCGVFIRASSETGEVWVAAAGGSRTLLEHVRIFERNLIEMFGDAKQSF